MGGYTGLAGIVVEVDPAKKRGDGLPDIKVIGFFETGNEMHQYLEEEGFSLVNDSIVSAWVDKRGVYALESTMYIKRPLSRR